IAQFIYRYITLIVRMEQKGALYSNFEILNKLGNLIFMLVFYYFIGAKFEIIVFSIVVIFCLITIYGFYIEKKYCLFNTNEQSSVSYKEIVKFGFPLLFTSIITWLFQSVDKYGLRIWSSFEELGLYAAAFKIVALVNVVQVTFSNF